MRGIQVVVESRRLGRMAGRLRAILLLALLCGLGGFACAAHAGYAAIVVDGVIG